MRNLLIFMFLVAVFVLGNRSCNGFHFGFGGITGTGSVQKEIRTANNFHALDLQISGDVEVTIGESYSVEIFAQSNLLPVLKTAVEGGTLRIYSTENFNTSEGVKIKVTAPAFDQFSLDGSGTIRVLNELKADIMTLSLGGSGEIICSQGDFNALNTSIDGSGTIELGGKANDMKCDISGSGDVSAKKMTTNTLIISISGSGTVTADVIKHLNASISGSGEVFYTGSPSVETSVSGSGSVKRAEIQ